MARSIDGLLGRMTNKQNSNELFPLTLSVADAAHILDVVPATLYQWVRDDELPSLRFGGRIRIPTAKLADILGVSPTDLASQLEPRVRVRT
jgi:excisionase family DNA binding protein